MAFRSLVSLFSPVAKRPRQALPTSSTNSFLPAGVSLRKAAAGDGFKFNSKVNTTCPGSWCTAQI